VRRNPCDRCRAQYGAPHRRGHLRAQRSRTRPCVHFTCSSPKTKRKGTKFATRQIARRCRLFWHQDRRTHRQGNRQRHCPCRARRFWTTKRRNQIYFPRHQEASRTLAPTRLVPRGVDREVVDTLHRTHMGDDQDAEHILHGSLRTALADGWGGSMMATDISDILFGTPSPAVTKVNLGVLKDDEVNILVHGHEPTLSAMIVRGRWNPR
jgi:hypothetical protein